MTHEWWGDRLKAVLLSEKKSIKTDQERNAMQNAADELTKYLDEGLTDEEIADRMTFKIQGKKLTKEEAEEFIEMVRALREKKPIH